MKTALLCILMVGYSSVTRAMDSSYDMFDAQVLLSMSQRKYSDQSIDGSRMVGGSETNSAHSAALSRSLDLSLSPAMPSKDASPPSRRLPPEPTPAELLEQGTKYHSQQQYSQATDCFNKIINQTIDPKAAAWGNLYMGDIHRMLDRPTDAVACMKRVINQTVNPEAAAWGNLYMGEIGYAQKTSLRDAYQYVKRAAGQNHVKAVVCKAAILLSKMHCDTANYIASLECLTYVITNKEDDPESTAKANFLLGMQCEHGEGTSINADFAQIFYERASDQSVDITSSLAAKICLCDMAYNQKIAMEERLCKNKIAKEHCDAVIVQAVDDPYYLAKARLRRAVLCHEGGFGIEKDLKQAADDLRYVLKQRDDPKSAEMAKTLDLRNIDLINLDDFE